jgi:hypothetical protein
MLNYAKKTLKRAIINWWHCVRGRRKVDVGLGEQARSDLRRVHHGALRRRPVQLCVANLGGRVSSMGYQQA